jgi:antitoxin component of MazEF toxin-antitoxin module
MHELFRMKIAAKRQMTAPQRLLDALSLSEGDEIQIEVADGQIVGTHACKAVPTALLSEELLSKIKKRESRLVQGKGLTVEEALPAAGASISAYEEAERALARLEAEKPSKTVAAQYKPKTVAAQYKKSS